jgi:hypothetical protein
MGSSLAKVEKDWLFFNLYFHVFKKYPDKGSGVGETGMIRNVKFLPFHG